MAMAIFHLPKASVEQLYSRDTVPLNHAGGGIQCWSARAQLPTPTMSGSLRQGRLSAKQKLLAD